MVFGAGTPAIVDAWRELGGLDARTVVASTTASDSIAKLRIPVFMNVSCLNQ
jgi:hypothetical protein